MGSSQRKRKLYRPPRANEYKELSFVTPSLEDLFAFFDSVDLDEEHKMLRVGYTMDNVQGDFVESNLRTTAVAIKYLMGERVIQPGMTFCDAGSGDGRITYLAELMGLDAFGIDFSNKLGFWDRVATYQTKLQTQQIIKDVEHLIQGDFTNDNTYLGVDNCFEGVSIFYNYINSYLALGKKINKQSPSGTIFMLHGDRGGEREILANCPNLTLRETVTVSLEEVATIPGLPRYYFIFQKQ